eukprot:190540_1
MGNLKINLFPIICMLWIVLTLEWTENTLNTNLYRQSGSFVSVNRIFTFIGFHNKSIFILGGKGIGGDVFLEFSTVTRSYSIHENAITFGYQFGQSSVQRNTMLYMLPYRTKNIIVYDLKSLTLSTQLIYPGTSTSLGRCVTYINDYENTTYSDVYVYDCG